MSSGIVRVRRRTSAYVMMDKTALMDARLSWRAKGLLAHLLSRPDDWKVLVSDLVRHAKDGRDSTRRALQELRTYGYASLRIARDARGVIREWEFLVYETPEDRERMEREDAEQGTLFDPARPVPQPRPKPGPKDRRQQRRRERAFKREVTAELGTPAGDSAKPETANPYLAGAPQPDTDSPDLASPEVGGPSLASISSTNERPTNTAAAACAQSARNSEVMTASHAVAPDAAAAVAVAVGGQTTPEADPEAVKQLVERGFDGGDAAELAWCYGPEAVAAAVGNFERAKLRKSIDNVRGWIVASLRRGDPPASGTDAAAERAKRDARARAEGVDALRRTAAAQRATQTHREALLRDLKPADWHRLVDEVAATLDDEITARAIKGGKVPPWERPLVRNLVVEHLVRTGRGAAAAVGG